MRYLIPYLLYLHISPCTQQQLLTDILYVRNNYVEMPKAAVYNLTEMGAAIGEHVEEHQVTTEDGYILTIFRLKGTGPALLLQHGLSSNADSFFLRGNTSLPVVLKNAGYDVWIGSERGSRYARKHVSLNPDTDKDFWAYSYHEHGYYDIPAMIDYILDKSKKEKLSIIGHSQGNLATYIMGSTRPEYNDKVEILIALAPVAFVDHAREPVKFVLAAEKVIDRILEMTGQEEVLADNNLLKLIYRMACSSKTINYSLCSKGIFMAFSGQNPKEFEPDFTTIVAGHYPDVISRKSANHFFQSWRTRRFAMFDYGEEANLKLYNMTVPPDYDLPKVTMKVAMFFAPNDNFSVETDVKRLKKKLPNVVRFSVMPKLCSHLDFLWGKKTHKYLAKQIIEVLNKYLKL